MILKPNVRGETPIGRSPKPLTWLVEASIADWPEFAELAAQGHTILVLGSETTADVIAGPRCHRMNEDIRKWFDEMKTEAWRVKYSKRVQ